MVIKAANKNQLRTNQEINAPTVRLISDQGEQLGIVPLKEALAKALAATLDLVEIAPQSDPPVCKLMDYGKHVFEIKKSKAASKKKQKRIQVKEVKFRPVTEEGDYQVKLRNLIRFLEGGDKAKVTLRFRGREMAHKELGMTMIERIEQDLLEYGQVEQVAKQEGRQIIMVLSPKKNKR